MERFTTNNTNTDPFIRNNQDTNPAKFGHINAIVDVVTALQNIPPGSATLQTASDAGGFNDGSTLREGSYDFGGQGGISRICSVGYEDMWQAGIHHIFDSNGLIRESNNCFNIIPDNTFDDTLRFKQGSRWVLDDGTTYVCYDATTGAAVWIPNSGSFTPTVSNETFNEVVSPLAAYYSMVNNVVTCTYFLEVALDAAETEADFELSLPVASNFTNAKDLVGIVAYDSAPADLIQWGLQAETANNTAKIYLRNATMGNAFQYIYITLQYLVL